MNEDQLEGKAKQAEGQTQESWGDAKDKAGDALDDVKDKAGDALDDAKDKADDAWDDAKDKLGALKDKVDGDDEKETARSADEGTNRSDLRRAKPLEAAGRLTGRPACVFGTGRSTAGIIRADGDGLVGGYNLSRGRPCVQRRNGRSRPGC